MNPYTCNACLDCVVNCPSNAISYKKGKSNES
ncbi:MAG: 4Fe-4S binding protein [Actinomycetota bacterium]